MSETKSNNETKISPLRKAAIVAGLSVVAVLGLTKLGACEGDRASLGEKGSFKSTTTTTEATKPVGPWYEKFGWDEDYAAASAQNHLTLARENNEKVAVAAGRCTVTLFDNGVEDYFTVIKNPIIHIGEHDGIKFTTFTGISHYVVQNTGERSFFIETVSVVEGEVFWGNFGIIPNQSSVTDQQTRLENKGEEIFDYKAYAPSFYDDLEFFKQSPNSHGYIPGEVNYYPMDRPDLVTNDCLSPASIETYPPEAAK